MYVFKNIYHISLITISLLLSFLILRLLLKPIHEKHRALLNKPNKKCSPVLLILVNNIIEY
uniref:Uncharacterized protein n=1 Tax=Cannabis sativa TaxID=3483 RepID=A0A803R152_CANSA